jgi:3-oxoadipate enol-lactonase
LKPVDLFFQDTGSGEPLLLAHAIGCDHRMWDPVVPLLADSFRVIRFDARGHGRSPVPPRPYTLGALAADAVALMDKLRIEKAHWVGVSMGAMVGMALALEHPDRVARMVLANSTSSYGIEGRAMWQARAAAVEGGGLAAICDMAMGRYFSEPFRTSRPDIVKTITERFLATPVQGYLGCCDAIAELDFAEAIRGIRSRTLVIAGEADAGTPPAMSRVIADRIPDARLAVLPEAAHLSPVEKPAEFAALVREFLMAPR